MRIPNTANVRWNGPEMNAEPLSTKHAEGTPRDSMARRSAASKRTVSSAWPHRHPGTARLQSSTKANSTALRPPTFGPCNPSPVHSSPNRVFSNRPNACGGAPSGAVRNPTRAK